MRDVLFVIAGFVLLFGGGELLVRGAVSAARRLGISELVIGLTVVGFGTSMPEMLVSVEAAFKGRPEIAIGNVVGSNIANILLIAGFTGLMAPSGGWGADVKRDVRVMLGATALLLVAAAWGALPTWGGVLLLALLSAYLYAHYRASGAVPEDLEVRSATKPAWLAGLLLLAGLALLFVGADMLIEGASAIALALGVSEAVVGLSIVAVGTSLPELATSVVAAWRGRTAVAIGNVVGSNIFNILAILGVTALVAPLPIAERFLRIDVPLVLAISIVFALILSWSDRLGRKTGGAMLAAYAFYTACLYLSSG
ncbi:calcium/sodium antiporter [Nitratireductor mangrovi]|uniref:Calcium/sodium antiporter n=1 Tax=Nitratireductor mangrovi TaxID=2599600 RepID=A0A5B8L059_9HYPH|nr:calcium/sodium antiporter [Nitratireductor mangrovi]QDZ01020.1 calcium/sodium antiporter [Nitratireductor mangrovi]